MKFRKAIAQSLATTVAVLGLSLCVETGARAQEPARPCLNDIEKLCSTVKAGGGRLVACLKEHEAQVSAACKANIAELKEAIKEIKAACHDDFEKLCPGVKPGQGRVLDCLKSKEAQLSADCKAAL